MTRPGLSPLPLTLLASVWMATLANLPLWRELRHAGLLRTPADWTLAAALGVVICSALVFMLSFAAWRWILKPAIVVLLIVSALGCYFMWTYHVVIDGDMFVNVIQSDMNEARALLSAAMAGTLSILAVVPALAVWRVRLRVRPIAAQSLRNIGTALVSLLVLVVTVIAAYQPLSSAMRNHKQLRYLMNPLNAVYAAGYAAMKPFRRNDSFLEAIGMDAVAPTAASHPPLLILVLGETARADNFSLNGYGRPTTPELQQHDVTTFRNAVSCGTSTAASVPCMFSHLGRGGFESRSRNYENLLDVLQRAGLAVLWLDNQAGCKAVCARVPSVSTSSLTDPDLCTEGDCLDGILLKHLDAAMASLPPERRARGTVIVMHQMGSHGPAYYRRSPPDFKRFMPECTSNNLPLCSSSSLLNAYDNSIAYTDHVLASTISWLKTQENLFSPAMVYVSDHGESLGEGNLYLHGLPYPIAPDHQKRVPWITWLSAKFAARTSLDAACLRARSDIPVSHDNYFHSVLGLMQVRTTAYRQDMDVYAGCSRSRAKPEPATTAMPQGRSDGPVDHRFH